jgi:hypothetical protein
LPIAGVCIALTHRTADVTLPFAFQTHARRRPDPQKT